MSSATQRRRVDATLRLDLSRSTLEAAGLRPGDEVTVEAGDGRVVIARAGDADAEALSIFERSLTRYGRTYAILAR